MFSSCLGSTIPSVVEVPWGRSRKSQHGPIVQARLSHLMCKSKLVAQDDAGIAGSICGPHLRYHGRRRTA